MMKEMPALYPIGWITTINLLKNFPTSYRAESGFIAVHFHFHQTEKSHQNISEREDFVINES